MIERVAGAIYAANFPGFQPWEEALEDWKYWLASNPKAKADGGANVGASLIAARAAISAMREPIEAMVEEASSSLAPYMGFNPDKLGGRSAQAVHATAAVWEAMIDAALKE